MKVSKEFKVGLLVILGLLLLFIGVNFLKGGSIFSSDREFYAVFDNSVGLQPSNDVKLSGHKIGQVDEVGLHPDNPTKILVKFSIVDDALQIPANSEAWIITDILATASIDIRLDTLPQANLTYYENGDTMISNIEKSIGQTVSEQMIPLKMRTEELITSVDEIIVSIGAFWDTSAAYTIEESMYEVREAIGTFSELANNLSILINQETALVHKILGDVNEITTSLADKKDSIQKTLDNITAISDTIKNSDLKGAILEAKNTLSSVNDLLTSVNNGEGTLGALMKDSTLYYSFVGTNESVKSLLEDFEANPWKYVHFSLFGRKVKGIQLTAEEEKKLKEWLDKQP